MTHGFSTHRAARLAACGFASTLIITGAAALAGPSGGGYDLSWSTIDGGGGTSSGGTLLISDTIGQCDAGVALTGGTFSLVGGFWTAPVAASALPCPADFDGSHVVNGVDLAMLLAQWSGASVYAPCPPFKPQDLNSDFGVSQILTAFPKMISKVAFINMGNDPRLKNTYRALEIEKKQGNFLGKESRLEIGDEPGELFVDGPTGMSLRVLYPTYAEHLAALSSSDAENRGCAVLQLRCGNSRVVYSGDATMHAWRYIARRLSSALPLQCDIATAPHHGGHIGSVEKRSSELQELYGRILRPRLLVVSVGTTNPYGHPFEETIAAATGNGASVMCTQITGQCCSRPLKLGSGLIARPSPVAEMTSGVACAGTIVAEISAAGVTIARAEQHRQMVEKLASSPIGTPLCLAQVQAEASVAITVSSN